MKKPPAVECYLEAFAGAANGARTRDPQLGKLMLYQLSYCRITGHKVSHIFGIAQKWRCFFLCRV